MKRWPLITGFVLFIALCVSAAYWAMQLFQPHLREVAAPPRTEQPLPTLDAAANLLGGRPIATVASNFQLKGVVVSNNADDSVAILAANGKPAHAVKANSEVVPGVVLKEVNKGYVLLTEGGAIKRVELPANAAKRIDSGTSPAPVTFPSPVTSPPPGSSGPPLIRPKFGTLSNARSRPPTP